METLMFRLSLHLSSYLCGVLQHAPTNRLLARLRTRQGLRWSIPVVLVLVLFYLFAASIVTTVIEDSGPGWLNLIVILLIWNAFKFAAMVPVSLWVLLKARCAECRRRRAARHEGYAPGHSDHGRPGHDPPTRVCLKPRTPPMQPESRCLPGDCHRVHTAEDGKVARTDMSDEAPAAAARHIDARAARHWP
jgi:hypothetical protein